METYVLIALILVVTTGASLFNLRVLRLPESVGLMATALVASLALLLCALVFPSIVEPISEQIAGFDFSFIVLDLLLGFLIFAGAFSSDTAAMARERWPILLFATVGILISTFFVGGAMWFVLGALDISIPFLHCLLFGALISPTDPIAVLAILKTTTVPRSLRADIAGESLLNDGVAVVVFLTLFELAGGEGHTSGSNFGVWEVTTLFSREVIGGLALGFAGAFIAKRALKISRIDTTDIHVTLTIVMAVYGAAWILHVSGPLAIVVVGIMLRGALHETTVNVNERDHVEVFWESIDHILNAVLFTLMGFILINLAADFTPIYLVVGLLAIPVVLAARLFCLGTSIPFTQLRCGNIKTTLSLLTWGGLRGGISIALALSLQPEMSRELIVVTTYVVVVFSILVQGLTISPLVRKLGITNPSH